MKRRATRSVVGGCALVVVLTGMSGCASHDSSFCQAVRAPMNGFSNSASVVTQLAAFDAIVDRTAGRDRADLLAIRAYFEILFLRVLAEPVKRSESERSAALRRFFRTDGPRLDFRLRNECRVSLEGELAPFVAQPASS